MYCLANEAQAWFSASSQVSDVTLILTAIYEEPYPILPVRVTVQLLPLLTIETWILILFISLKVVLSFSFKSILIFDLFIVVLACVYAKVIFPSVA